MQTQSALVRAALKQYTITWIACKHGRYFPSEVEMAKFVNLSHLLLTPLLHL